MRYISTRHGSQGSPQPLDFEEVMLAGLARDGGLYLPQEWPLFSKAEIASSADSPVHVAGTFSPAASSLGPDEPTAA